MPRPLVDLTGERFGALVVIGRSHTRRVGGSTLVYWLCL